MLVPVFSSKAMPLEVRYSLASWIGLVEELSDLEYSSPTFWRSGSAASIRSITILVFRASLVPVTLPPGAFMSATIPSVMGSETAEKMMGISVSSVVAMAVWTAGVAMGTITSTSSAII